MKVLIIFLFSSLSLCTNVHGQNIDAAIEKYANNYALERTYLHFDKASYSPGDTIWFKAYLMEGIYPASGSKTLYVDWTDDKGNVLQHSLGPILKATSIGQFGIPENYTGRFIHVKAYTKWMLNFDSSFLYNNDIRILSKTNQAHNSKISLTPSIQFFPEGGDMIAGLNNKIAFKANDQFGRPVDIKGAVVDKTGKTIANLDVMHDGMGFFFLQPAEGASYTAKWSLISAIKDEKAKQYSTDLPRVKPSGVVLSVTSSANSRVFNITTTPAQAAVLGNVNIIGTMYQHEVFKVTKDISTGEAKGLVPVTDLPSGILTFTVLDDKWNPIAERITFINNGEYQFYPEMEVQHWGLNKRARNEVEISVPDSLEATFSVAVTDIDIETDSSDNIISHLLLTSELKGKVFNPASYFSNNSDSVSQQLDLVMLTNGWRRIKWQEVINGELPEIIYQKDSSYLTLSGKLYGATPSQLRDAGNIVLMLNNKVQGKKMSVLPVEKDGTFNDHESILFDTTNIFYQLSQEKGLTGATVKFLENRLPPLANNIPAIGNYYAKFFDTAGNARQIELARQVAEITARYKGKILETVTINVKAKTPVEVLEETYPSGFFKGGDGYQFDLVHDTRAASNQSIFTYLQGQVAGLQISADRNPPSLIWRGGAPALFLNEIPSDASLLSSISIHDVAYIKVLRPPFMGSSGGANGAIAVYTKKGDDAKSADGKGLPSSTVNGYTTIREFYSPNYGTFSPNDDRPDLRTTIYWNPQVITTREKNKVVLTFYNTDITRAFRVIIEGISKDGRLAHLEQIME